MVPRPESSNYIESWQGYVLLLTLGLIPVLLFGCTQEAPPSPDLVGVVRSGSGGPLPGAMVTLRPASQPIEVTVFTDSSGQFRFTELQSDTYQLRAHRTGWKTSTKTLWLPAQPSKIPSPRFILKTDQHYTRHLTSSSYLSLLPESPRKREFILNCTTCHQLRYTKLAGGRNSLRNGDQWMTTMQKMRQIDIYSIIPPDMEFPPYADWLSRNLTMQRARELPAPPPVSTDVQSARITEYPVRIPPSQTRSMELSDRYTNALHDQVVGPEGLVWFTAFYNNQVWSLHPETGTMKPYVVNENKEKSGDVRALDFGPDGYLWIILGGTKSLVKLDTGTGEYETYDIGVYAHSLDVDSQGRIWFNGYFTDPPVMGFFDPETEKTTFYDLPDPPEGVEAGLPLPYGLIVDHNDIVWNTLLAANRLVRFDPRTETMKSYEMPTPNAGPRRPAVGPDGAIWIPEFNTGKLARFDPEAETFQEFRFGNSSLGPYDAVVNQQNGAVWMTASLDSSLIRFDPETASWDRYPFPTQPAYTRHLAVNPRNGNVWSSYSSLPPVHSKVVRVNPSGD